LIILDEDFRGKERVVKEQLINLFRKYKIKYQEVSLLFKFIGKQSPAHKLAISSLRKKIKCDIILAEEEILKEVSSRDSRIRPANQALVGISSVILHNSESAPKDRFEVGERISIDIEYSSNAKIDSPVFGIEIIRSDGITCCSSNSKRDGFNIKEINGIGRIKININQ